MTIRVSPVLGLLCGGLLGVAGPGGPARSQDLPPAAGPADGSGAPFSELNEALAAARARLDDLTSAAEIADRASSLRGQIQQLEEEKSGLEAQLKDERASRRAAERWGQQAEAELAETRQRLAKLQAEQKDLTEAADRSMAMAARLRGEVKTAKDQTAVAINARNAAESRLVEMQRALDQARTEVTALEDRGERIQGELVATSAAYKEEQRALASARDDERELQDQLTELQAQLVTSGRQLTVLNTRNADLEQELRDLREAAKVATTAARDNLIAMENKIRLLNTALAEVGTGSVTAGDRPIEPAAGPDGAGGPEADDLHSATDRGGDGPIQAALVGAGAAERRSAGFSGPRVERAPLPPAIDSATVRREIGLVPVANAATSDGLQAIKEHEAARLTLAELTTGLPAERRMHAQSLAADLDAKAVQGGLRVTVAGSELFALNSERIEDAAYDTLGKVAELLDIYDDQPVVITGHTDAMGDEAYNLRLSERRADLVKAFFIDQFDIGAERLETRGAGEAEPVASNATLEGRKANRRVEVEILN